MKTCQRCKTLGRCKTCHAITAQRTLNHDGNDWDYWYYYGYYNCYYGATDEVLEDAPLKWPKRPEF